MFASDCCYILETFSANYKGLFQGKGLVMNDLVIIILCVIF